MTMVTIADPDTMLALQEVKKTFTMHLQGGLALPVFENVTFDVARGECVVLSGPSGIGKSSILKMVYGNYRTEAGEIAVRRTSAGGGETVVNVALSDARSIMNLRRSTIGYISQFLRVIPRVNAVDVVAEAATNQSADRDTALRQARDLLARLNLPERLWSLPPATFSGGEQQRVNIARGFIADYPVLLLDEPTASLDAKNRAVVAELISEKKAMGVAMLGIFHDEDMREKVADRYVDVSAFTLEKAA
ncbi:MAG: phosphonate C-P lyase system protein PhnL [Pseudomonadota bacterium]